MKRAGDVLSVFFDERLMKKAKGYSRLFSFWAEAAQKNGIAAAADHSRIRELDRGMLMVEADHPGWIQILQTKEHKLLDDFHRAFPDMDITGISIMLSRGGPQPETGEECADELVSPAGAAAEESAVDDRAAGENAPLPESFHDQTENTGYNEIKDDALKETLKRLEKSITAKERERKKRSKE
ncbi:hypothetical protein AGMMS50293_01680 [Spirochaetia bacterium]|nr:hypothetical protein AGMMS50293_01680 [Spirochaetia bacterium]